MNYSYFINLTIDTNQYILLENQISSWKIGRSRKSNIPLEDKQVSRNHALLFRDGQRYYLVDLNSKNGTYLNGHKISDRIRLKTGDFISIGQTRLQFVSYSSQAQLDDYLMPYEKLTKVLRLAAQLSTSTPDSISSEQLIHCGVEAGIIKPEYMYRAIALVNRESPD